MNRSNYIFVDFENVQEVDLGLLAGKPVSVIFILGERHRTLPVEMVDQLLCNASQVRVVRSTKPGKNTLDFVLACEVGIQAAKDPKGFFHILSKDKGFDALVAHLKKEGFHASRHEVFAKIPALARAPVLTMADRVERFKERMPSNPASRPKREKALRALLRNLFGSQISEPEEEQALLDAVVAAGLLEVTPQGAVNYLL